MSEQPRGRRGFKLSEEHKEKIRQSKIGEKNPMYGRNFTEEHRRKLGIASAAKTGENHGTWKGDKVGYAGVHAWVKKILPKPELCQMCKIKPPCDLANITGIYSREVKNWQYLCRKCHMRLDFDRGIRIVPKGRKPSEETKKKLREARLRYLTPEKRKAISESLIRYFKIHPRKCTHYAPLRFGFECPVCHPRK